MKILLINHYAGSPFHGMEFRPYYLAKRWVEMGHQVEIIAGSYSHIRDVNPDSTLNFEVLDGISYHWYKTPSYEGNGVGRVLSIISFIKKIWFSAQKIARELKPDVVIASSTYPMDIWPARRIARAAGARLVFEVHDLWPLSPMELGGMSKWHPFIMWVQMAEDYAYRHADKVISMLPKAMSYMCSRGMAESKFAHIPNGIDETEWEHPESLPEAIEQHWQIIQQSGRPVVGYAGTHGLANALDDLLNVAHRLQGHAEVVLVGTGPERERLLARVKNENLTNVHMLPAIPKRSIPFLLKKFDIAYIGWHLNPLYRFGISPNKLMDYMMAARPVVHAVSAGNDPVAEAGCGITIPSGDIEAITNAVLDLVALTSSERDAIGQLGKAFILNNQTYTKLAQKFLNQLSK